MNILSFLFFSFFLPTFFIFPHQISSNNYKDLIFKGCATQKFQDTSGDSSQNLKTIFQTLSTQSLITHFSNTSTTGTSPQSTLVGLYQCRGDLSSTDCNDCVSEFPKLSKKYCGEVIAARIQLLGCYMQYEVSGFMQISNTDMLYRYCKASQVMNQNEFDEGREMAFGVVEKGVGDGGSGSGGGGGFNATDYQGLYVLGQCEGDLSGQDCGDCVKTAFERVKAECGGSSFGQVYLNKCYVSYNYKPSGVGQENELASAGSGSKKSRTEKTIAIVVGGTAGAGFVIAVLLFLKSVCKKKRSNKQGHGNGYGQGHAEYYY